MENSETTTSSSSDTSRGEVVYHIKIDADGVRELVVDKDGCYSINGFEAVYLTKNTRIEIDGNKSQARIL